MRRRDNCAIRFNPAFLLSAAFALVLLPLKWLFTWGFAILVHEVCHIICIKAMKQRILAITFDGAGAIIEAEPMLPLKELICALAGTIGALLLLLFSTQFPMLAICALIQSAFNLLPYYPLDGGRALYNLILILSDEMRAAQVTKCVSFIVIILLLVFSLIMQIQYRCGIVPMCLTILLFFKSNKCNYSLQTAQSNSTIY